MYQNEVPVELNKVYFSDTIDFFLLHNTEEEHHVCSVDVIWMSTIVWFLSSRSNTIVLRLNITLAFTFCSLL